MSTHLPSVLRRPKAWILLASAILTAAGVVGALTGSWPLVAVTALLILGSLPPLVTISLARTKFHLSSIPAATVDLNRRRTEPGASDKKQAKPKTTPAPATQPGFDVEDEWARRCREGFGGKFESFALQSRSLHGRNVFARAATGGQHDWPGLARVLRLAAAGYRGPGEAVKSYDPQFLRPIARLMVNQRAGRDDLHDALALYEALAKLRPEIKDTKSDLYLKLDAAAALGEVVTFRETLKAGRFKSRDPFHAACISANMIADSEHPDWLTTVNAPFIAAGVEPISFDSGPGVPFDRLSVAAPARAGDDPLITVIVPTYEPDERLLTAIRSLTAQTWQNLEIIIVDDHSSDQARSIIQTAASSDERVKVIYSDRNQGSYASRNLALRAATGKYVTCHDDDDWSHPRKLEVQASLLEAEPSLYANMSKHVRSSEQMQFTRINVNPSFAQSNFSSLMFRRDVVVDRCGRWDEVRKGADAEFKERLEAAFGFKIPTVGDAPMSFTRTRLDSLTAGEMVRGYVDPRRVAYMRSFQKWHQSRPEDWRLGDTGTRRFPIPPGIAGSTPGPVDIIFATDFRFPGGTSALTLGEVSACLDAGYSVGLLQLESPLNSYTAPLVDPYWEAVDRGAVMLTPRDEVEAGLMVIRHPSVLQFADGQPASKISAREMLLVVNHLPVMKDGRGSVFDVDVAADNAQRIFGTRPSILPESGVTRASLNAIVNPAIVADQNWPGFVDDDWFGEPRTVQERRPVVGRHGRDNWIKWPAATARTLEVYDQPEVFETRILGGIGSIAPQLPAETVERWRVYEFNQISPKDFVRDLDFWVFFHHKDSQESFGMAIAEAMASGAVVILPRYLEKTFGDGAVYCTPQTVAETVKTYWSDAGLYLMQSRRGMEFARANFSSKSFLQRVMERLG